MTSKGAEYEIGYRKPPASTRFRKGQSGNPKGRPKGRKNVTPYEAVLGQMVTIREDGVARRVTAAEAFMLNLIKCGLKGDRAAAQTMIEAIQRARAARGSDEDETITVIVNRGRAMGGIPMAITSLRMAVKLDPYRPTARTALEPWLVTLALERLGERRLSRGEQEKVVNATRNPNKVRWPDWWEVRK